MPFLVALAVACISVGPALAQPIQARVVSVADGDSLAILKDGVRTTLRLAEVDAPERTQPYSQVSRRNLIALCKEARVIAVEPVGLDRYGRNVAHVYCDGVHVNWRQVQDGLAWCFPKYLTQPAVCLPIEREAREARRGLWREESPIPPWEYRATARQ
jgi:micrococcal nuclease